MAARPFPLRRAAFSDALGWVAVALVSGFILFPLLAVFWRAGGASLPGPADWSALRFTVLQSVLSAFFSIALAVPVARALARRQFAGRGLMITLLGAPFILPVIVRRSGSSGRVRTQRDRQSGHGVGPVSRLCRSMVCMVLCWRMCSSTCLWQRASCCKDGNPSRLNVSALQLALALARVTCFICWSGPCSVQLFLAWAMVVFAICLSSFAVALTLGGGPRATTVELAIYQAFRFDFDLGRAAVSSGDPDRPCDSGRDVGAAL